MRSSLPRASSRLLCACLAAAFLASCGGGSSDEGTSTPDATVSDSPLPEPATLPVATTDDDIARLRQLGFEVFETPDIIEDSSPDQDTSLQLFETSPDASTGVAASTFASSLEQPASLSTSRSQPLIVGGSFAQSGQFPYAVFVSTPSGSCTGSLIGRQWVKTAAHCVAANTVATSIRIALGSVIRASGVEVIYADYFVRISNDTALIHLPTASNFTPVAYNGDASFNTSGPYVTIGFGRDSENGSAQNLKLVQNTVSTFDSVGGMILGETGGMSTVCFGDSGGPTLRFNPAGYPIDIATSSATYAPVCTGRSYHTLTSYIASSIQQVTGILPGTIPSSNQPPSISAVGALETPLGPTSVAISATDPEGDPIVYTASNLPPGLAIDPSTGVISGTTTDFTYRNPYATIVVATDKKTGAGRSIAFPWRVNTPGNADPHVMTVPFQSVRAGSSFSLAMVGNDPNGDTIDYTATGLPPGLNISSQGVISGVPTLGGQYQVNVLAFDGKGGLAIQWFTIEIQNAAPNYVHVTPTQVPSYALGATVSYRYNFVDPDGDSVTVTAEGLPRGLAIDPATSTIKGTASVAGSFVVTLVASDPYGGKTNFTLNFFVSTTLNSPPTMTQLQSRTDLPGVALSIPIQTTDPDGHRTTIAFRNLPTGIIYNAITKTLGGTPTKSGVFLVDYYVYDPYGARTTYPQITWTIPNRPPTIGSVSNATLQPGSLVSIPVSASDPDGHTFSLTATGLPKGVLLNRLTNTITGTVMQGGTFSVVITATDKYFAKTVAEPFTITVPNESPVIGSQISNMTVLAGTPVNVPLNISDPDGHKLSLSIGGLTVVTTPSSLPPGLVLDALNKRIYGTPIRPGTFRVSIKVSDAYGAASYMDPFVWTVTNQKAVLSPVSSQSLRVGTPFTLQLSATDPDGHPITYTAYPLPTGLRFTPATGLVSGTPTRAGTFAVRLGATDKYGGASTPLTVSFVVAP